MLIPDVLAERYVTNAVAEPYSPKGKIRRMRDLWISVMRYQRELGVPIPPEEIGKFMKAKNNR